MFWSKSPPYGGAGLVRLTRRTQTAGSFIHGGLSSHVELRSDDVLALDALVQGVIQHGHEPLAKRELGIVVVCFLPPSKNRHSQ